MELGDVLIQPGSSILQGGGLTLRPRYVTRILVDRDAQRKQICGLHSAASCYPCCNRSSNRSVWTFLWSIIGTSTFVTFLHLLSLIASSMKIVPYYHNKDGYVGNMLTYGETFLVFCVVLIHMGKVNGCYGRLCNDSYFLRMLPNTDRKMMTSVKSQVYCFGVTSAFLLLLDSCVLLILGHLQHTMENVHLGWSILPNQAVCIITTSLSHYFCNYINHYKSCIEKDGHHVVLMEAMLLLRETANNPANTEHNELTQYNSKVAPCPTNSNLTSNSSEEMEKVACFMRSLYGSSVFKAKSYFSCTLFENDDDDLWNAIIGVDAQQSDDATE